MTADVADYSRLTEVAEEETHLRLRALRVGTIDPCVVSYRGQIVKNTGDGFLATFDSSLDAMRCAIEVQRNVTASESPKSPDRRIRLRMALNFGNVISDLGDVYGTDVNVAARLEQFAQPGGIVVSDALLEVVKTRMDVPVQDLGQLELKNISRPVQAYSLRVAGLESGNALSIRRVRQRFHLSPFYRSARATIIPMTPISAKGWSTISSSPCPASVASW